MIRRKSKIRWKRTRHGIVFEEPQTPGEWLANLEYMQVSIGMLIPGLLTLLGGLAFAVAADGQAPLLISLLWILSAVFCGIGFYATCYGHFHVKAKSRKIRWQIGFFGNGGVLLILIVIYILGIVCG